MPSTIHEVVPKYLERNRALSQSLHVTDVPGSEDLDTDAKDHVAFPGRSPGSTERSPTSPSSVGTRSLTSSFDAADFDLNATANQNLFIPPDPNAAAGRSHLVDAVNSLVEFYAKDGTPELWTGLQSFFAELDSQSFPYDPKVVYDPFADRFVLVALEQLGSSQSDPLDESRLFVGVSDDGDPRGDWYITSIDALTTVGGVKSWADFPGVAVDAQAVYITANLQSFGAAAFQGVRLWVIPKGVGSGGLYDGGAVTVTKLDPYAGGGVATTTLPASIRGAAPNDPGTFLVSYSGITDGTNEFVQVVRLDDPLGSPVLTQQAVAVGDLENLDGPLADAPQPGGVAPLRVGDRRALSAVWRANQLWLTATIRPRAGAYAGRTTAHWFAIDTTTPSNLVVSDQGDVGGDPLAAGAVTFYPSVAVNSTGVAAISFGASGTGLYPGAYWTMRSPGDAPGTTAVPGTLRAGVAYYVRTFGGSNRWGDFSSASDDVTDDCFWMFNAYAGPRGTVIQGQDGRWLTAYGRVCPDGADLRVDDLSASASTVPPSTPLTLSTTIRNQGNADAPATLVHYYVSSDATIDAGDTELASSSVGSIAGGASEPVTGSVTAPATPGSYWLGACVDSFAGEVSTANNCSAGVQLAVGAVPDLVVPSFTTNTPSLPSDANARLTVSADVSDTGTGAAPATTLKIYRSNDEVIAGTGDEFIDSVAIPALAAGETTHVTRTVIPGNFPGPYWFGACAVAVTDEIARANNCSVGVPVRIGAQPDLWVAFAKVTPNSVAVGDPFTFTVTVKNGNQGDSAATTARIYRSPDSTISRGDTQIGSVPVPIAARDYPISFPTVAPSTPGTYWYGTCVDSVPYEVNANDNCSSGARLTVAGVPNLGVTSPAVDSSTLRTGQAFTFTASVANTGNGGAAATTAHYRLSPDSTVTSADPEIGSGPVGALDAGASQGITGGLSAPSGPGDSFVGACVDPVAGETNTADNCSVGLAIHVARCTDADGDGFFAEGGVCGPVDCGDSSPSVNPAATEVCDGIDDDCDGQIDEGVGLAFHRDADQDGHGNPAVTVQACAAPPGYVANSTDCDDSNSNVNPERSEIPGNALDDDCDPATSDCKDLDGDGYGNPASAQCAHPQLDCNDGNPNINPGKTEIPGNGIDDDCNAATPGGCTTP
ncbi:MAG: hypothetical protein IPK07_28465 [Deltaproteobacteria bacterium]|nr:hypothetical protein [Deltaproteobacteria bacterium]